MNARALRLASLPLLCASTLMAQGYTGVGPTLARPLAEVPNMRPATFGVTSIEGMSYRRHPDGSDYFAVGGAATRTSPFRVSAWRRNPTTLQWTRLNDFDLHAQDGEQQVTLSYDLLTCVIFRAGFGLTVTTRASTAVPWGPRRLLAGLASTGGYSPYLGLREAAGPRSAGVQDILTLCSVSPPRLLVYDINAASALVSNEQVIRPPLGRAGHLFGLATGVENESGRTKAMAYIEEQGFGFGQRLFWTSGIEGTSPYHAVFDTPQNKFLTTLCLYRGGTLLAGLFSLQPTQPFPQDTTVRMDLYGSFDSTVAPNRELLMTLCTPAESTVGFGLLFLGLLGNGAFNIPGVIGQFGLAPDPLLTLDAQAMDIYMTWRIQVPTGVSGEAKIQGLGYDGLDVVVGGMATVTF